MSENPLPKLLRDGLRVGLGWGLAVGTVHLAIGVGLILSLGMPPMTWFVAKSILMEVPLAIAAGLVWSPLLKVRRGGRWLHPLALAASWIALERFVAVDPTKLQMWVAPSLVALALFALFRGLYGRWPKVVAGVAVAAPVLLIAVPALQFRLGGGYDVPEPPEGVSPPAGAPDVVFVVLDTVRAQSMSAYGYERQTSPVFDAFAREGVLFEQATAPSTWSLPAHASLFTGTFPSVHNGHGETRYLDDTLPTLADTMAEAGWETLCFTANAHISPSFGLTRGFGWSDQAWLTGAGGRGFSFIYRLVDALGATAEDKGGGMVAGNVERWMAQRPADAPPAFVFVNFLEAHFPFHQLPDEYRNAYTDEPLRRLRSFGQIAFGVQMGRQLTDEEYETIRQPILDLYDGGVRYTDALLGRVIDAWRQRGTLDETVFVVLADHGEMVGEHGAFGHLSSLYEQDLWVPFAIRYPARVPAGSRVEPPISTLGTYATILDLVGVEAPDHLQVDTLMPALDGRPAGQPVIAERFEEELLSARFAPGTANGRGPLLSPWGRYRTFRSGDLKLVKHYEHGVFSTHLFDLAEDPQESTDLASSAMRGADRQKLEDDLALFERALGLPPLDAEVGTVVRPEGGNSQLDDAAQEQLRALGYIE